jgi:hypothetical protein
MARDRRIIAKLKQQAVASRFGRQRIGKGGFKRGDPRPVRVSILI